MTKENEKQPADPADKPTMSMEEALAHLKAGWVAMVGRAGGACHGGAASGLGAGAESPRSGLTCPAARRA